MGRAFYNGSAHVAGNRSYRYKSGHFFRNKPSMQTMSPNHTPDTPSVFQLKGSMLAITVLELARNDLEALDRQLAAKVAQALADPALRRRVGDAFHREALARWPLANIAIGLREAFGPDGQAAA